MQLTSCTITGPDNFVDDLRPIKDLSARYPFVEWAMLYSPSNQGKPRYPTTEWLEMFHRECPELKKSLHLCHEALFGFIKGDADIGKVIGRFPRVQLNVGFGIDIEKVDGTALAQQIARYPDKNFVVQYSERTKHLMDSLGHLKNVEILFDASAGAGKSPDSWPKPLADRTCGFAGGIGPHNIASVLDTLLSVVPKGASTWIDMESRVRDANDRLDFGKVATVLEHVHLASLQPSMRNGQTLQLVFK